jgi:hypothetical protein
MRGKEEERPEKVRLSIEITHCLMKREASLADALDALTAVMLNALAARYGDRDEFFRFNEQVSKFLKSTERDRAVVGAIPYSGSLAVKVRPKTVTMLEERPERLRHLATEIGELLNKSRPSFGEGFDALTGTMLTAIEATSDRERADEFDLLIGGFLKWVQSGERVQ